MLQIGLSVRNIESAGVQPLARHQDIVVVVDDDLAVRNSMKFALELEGLQVHVCGSGEELLRHPDLQRAQCILLDYKMPLMDGFEVMDRLAEGKVAAPVILLTSAAGMKVSKRAHAAGFWCVLEKPFLDGTLLHSIRNALGNFE